MTTTTVNVVEPTGPYSPEQIASFQKDVPAEAPKEEAKEELIGGKFKNVDDLLKSYNELEKAYSKKGTKVAPAEAPAVESEDATSVSTEGDTKQEEATEQVEQEVAPEEVGEFFVSEKSEEDYATEVGVYGKAIADVFKEARLNAKAISTHFHATGEFPEDAYKALEEKGISKNIVDAYLDGSRARKDAAVEIAEREVSEIVNSVGGEAEYAKMIQWASSEIPEDEIVAFNALIESQDAKTIRLAVNGMKARYEAVNGKKPKLFRNTEVPRALEGGYYESINQLLDDQRDPRYLSGDKAFHAAVHRKVANSDIFKTKR